MSAVALAQADRASATPSSSRPLLIFAASALLFVAAIATLAYSMWLRRSEPTEAASPVPVRAILPLPADGALWFEDGVSLAFSRDGRMLAWVGGSGSARRIWVRASHDLGGKPLPGTETATNPFFSLDGQWIGFFTDGGLRKINVNGSGMTITPATDRGRGGAWGDDGTLVFTPSIDQALFRVSASGGEPPPVTKPATLNARSHRSPVWVPGRPAVVYTFRSAQTTRSMSLARRRSRYRQRNDRARERGAGRVFGQRRSPV